MTNMLKYEDFIGNLSAHSDAQEAVMTKLSAHVDLENEDGGDVEFELPFILDLFRGHAMFMRTDRAAKTGTIVMSGKATFIGSVLNIQDGDDSKLIWKWVRAHNIPEFNELKYLPVACEDPDISDGFPESIRKLAINEQSTLRKPEILDIIISTVRACSDNKYMYIAETMMEENDTMYYFGMSDLNWNEVAVDNTHMKLLEHYHWQSKFALGVPIECRYCTDDLEVENALFYETGKGDPSANLSGYCGPCVCEELLPRRYIKAWDSIAETDCRKTLNSWSKDGPPVWLSDPALPVPNNNYIRYVFDASGEKKIARYEGAPKTKGEYAEKCAEFNALIQQRLEFLEIAGANDEDMPEAGDAGIDPRVVEINDELEIMGLE